MQPLHYAIFCGLLLTAHLVQGITGFGAVVLSLPALLLLTPLTVADLIPALLVINIVQPLWIALSERRHINKREAGKMLGLALIGMPIGFWFFRQVNPEALKLGLGIFVVVVALINLPFKDPGQWIPSRLYLPLNFLGGMAQGALLVGGPFLVIYATRTLPGKDQFRATLMLAWAVINIVLAFPMGFAGAFSNHTALLLLLSGLVLLRPLID